MLTIGRCGEFDVVGVGFVIYAAVNQLCRVADNLCTAEIIAVKVGFCVGYYVGVAYGVDISLSQTIAFTMSPSDESCEDKRSSAVLVVPDETETSAPRRTSFSTESLYIAKIGLNEISSEIEFLTLASKPT